MSQNNSDFFDELRDSAREGMNRIQKWVSRQPRRTERQGFNVRLMSFRLLRKSIRIHLTIEPDNDRLEGPPKSPQLPKK